MKNYIVELKNIVKKYGNFIAVSNISLKIKEGSFFSLLGPSGCGKTTTLRMIGGFIDADEGEIFIDSKNMKGVPPNKRSTSLVFQNLALFPHMNVKENIIYGLKKQKVPREIIKSKLKRMLTIVNLTGLEHRRITELSGGQQQRVALARSLIIEPKILLLDEPLANLDKKLRISMQYELKEIQRRTGTTFLYVTHDQSEALTMSDIIAVMDNGKIVQTGTPSEIYNYPADIFVADFIGAGNFIKLVLLHKNTDINYENCNTSLEDFKKSNTNDMLTPVSCAFNLNDKNKTEKIIAITEQGGKIIHMADKNSFKKSSFRGGLKKPLFFIRPEKINICKSSCIKEPETAAQNNGDNTNNCKEIASDLTSVNKASSLKDNNLYQGIIESVIFEGPDIRISVNAPELGRLKIEVKNDRQFSGLTQGTIIDFFWDIQEGIVFF